MSSDVLIEIAVILSISAMISAIIINSADNGGQGCALPELRIILNFAFSCHRNCVGDIFTSHLLYVSRMQNLRLLANAKFIVQFSIECQQLLVSVAYLWYKARRTSDPFEDYDGRERQISLYCNNTHVSARIFRVPRGR